MKLKYFNSVSADEKPCFDISEDLGGGNFGYIGEVFEEANAAFIVKAVNNHDKLLEKFNELLYEAVNHWGGNELPDSFLQAISEAQEAIKQAEAE